MPKYQIDAISVALADTNQQLRASLKGVLHHHGFRQIQDANTVVALEEIVRNNSPDLILCDVDLPEGESERPVGNVCQMINRLRHNKVGQNPFASVILFIEEPNETTIRQASMAGIDDIQIKPVVAQKVINRVEFLIEKRKPFVVTTDYIGPDRRKGARAGSQEIPLVDVPNTIAAKANGTYNPSMVHHEIKQTLWDINAQKIERHAFQVSYLVERIVPAYREGKINKEVLDHVKRLVIVSKDIVDRLEDSDYGHIADLAETLKTVARSLYDSGTEPRSKDLNLLSELATAISATFKMDQSSAEFTKQIRSSVEEKYSRNK